MRAYFYYGCELTGNSYQEFLRYALENSDAFSVVDFRYTDRNWPRKKSCKNVLDALRPYRIKKRNNAVWPNMYVDTESEFSMHNQQYTVMVYKTDPKVFDALCKPGSLFAWNFPKYPMDLCFYKNNKCWFSSIAHEEFVWLYTDSKEMVEELRRLGIPFDDGEEVDERTLFFEEYTI